MMEEKWELITMLSETDRQHKGSQVDTAKSSAEWFSSLSNTQNEKWYDPPIVWNTYLIRLKTG